MSNKIIALIMLGIVISLVACGKKAETQNQKPAQNTQAGSQIQAGNPSDDISGAMNGADALDSDLNTDDNSAEDDAALSEVQDILFYFSIS